MPKGNNSSSPIFNYSFINNDDILPVFGIFLPEQLHILICLVDLKLKKENCNCLKFFINKFNSQQLIYNNK